MNILVEKKKEFIVNIINILTPLIFEGLTSIYNKAKEVSNGDNVLKIFQSFLKRIPKWTDDLLSVEINRIKTNSKDYDLLYDLIRASIKANLYILAYSPYQDNRPKINPDDYKSINFKDFIHTVYIECAREIWNNPYLFYHNYTGIEIKRNQRDTIELIKKCIEESIRKTLPLKHVLEIYLGDEMVKQVPNDDFEKTITEVDERNLKQLLMKDLNDKPEPSQFIAPGELEKKDILEDLDRREVQGIQDRGETQGTQDRGETQGTQDRGETQVTKDSSDSASIRSKYRKSTSSARSKTNTQSLSQKGGKISSSSNKDLNKKILNILNNKDIKFSDENNTSEKPVEMKKKLSETSSDELISTNMDTNLKKILKDDLGNTETESSANFKPEKTKLGYQEIFSNSNVDNDNNSTNSQQKNEEINKNKFFNNYLQF